VPQSERVRGVIVSAYVESKLATPRDSCDFLISFVRANKMLGDFARRHEWMQPSIVDVAAILGDRLVTTQSHCDSWEPSDEWCLSEHMIWIMRVQHVSQPRIVVRKDGARCGVGDGNLLRAPNGG